MVYRQQSFTYRSRLVDPLALQPLVRILAEDTRTVKAKIVGLRNLAAKGLKSCNTTLQQVAIYVGIKLVSSWFGYIYTAHQPVSPNLQIIACFGMKRSKCLPLK